MFHGVKGFLGRETVRGPDEMGGRKPSCLRPGSPKEKKSLDSFEMEKEGRGEAAKATSLPRGMSLGKGSGRSVEGGSKGKEGKPHQKTSLIPGGRPSWGYSHEKTEMPEGKGQKNRRVL